MSLNISEFTEVSLQYDAQDTACHRLLVKENVCRKVNKLKPAGRTLFVLNVPPYASEESLKLAFALAGPVSSILLQEKPSEEYDKISEAGTNRFKVAYVVYEHPAGLRKLLKSRKLGPLNSDGKLLTGIEKWVKAYQERIPDPVKLQQEIDRYMATYDEAVAKRKNAEPDGEPDDEGWVTVSKNNANVFSQREATINKMEEKMNTDQKQKLLKNFYTFQIREAKKQDVVSLRKKYDRDLQKMQQIKKTKRFKPY
ncbi:ribosomal RNA-processing protein 7 homolog A [Uranotaenia lowii]|uniref:ribosomal RNA-processing protein 7 homolog A n=1 Tax=Uranotaenia lowii TaxID=190385 RepID=UPI00247A518E|nr:ribosomal RNA-processing protein 7 homolog A [Uranotaenia lowii]